VQGHATRRPVLAGVLAQRGVRTGTDAGRTWAAEGHGRRLIFRTRNRMDPNSGFAKNGDAPDLSQVAMTRPPTPNAREPYFSSHLRPFAFIGGKKKISSKLDSGHNSSYGRLSLCLRVSPRRFRRAAPKHFHLAAWKIPETKYFDVPRSQSIDSTLPSRIKRLRVASSGLSPSYNTRNTWSQIGISIPRR